MCVVRGYNERQSLYDGVYIYVYVFNIQVGKVAGERIVYIFRYKKNEVYRFFAWNLIAKKEKKKKQPAQGTIYTHTDTFTNALMSLARPGACLSCVNSRL